MTSSRWIITILCAICLIGCKEDTSIKEFTREKEDYDAVFRKFFQTSTMSSHSQAHKNSNAALASRRAPLSWEKPSEWKISSKPGRLASFAIEGEGQKAECSILVLGGDGGGTFRNINRWRDQMGLTPLSAEVYEKNKPQEISLAGEVGHLVDLHGKYTGMKGESYSDARLLGAIAVTSHGALFVKLVGEKKLVSQNEEQFNSFLQSFRFSEKVVAPEPTRSWTWSKPTSWSITQKGSMRLASFDTPAHTDGIADCSLTILGKQDLHANVNRWREQVGLASLKKEELVQTIQETKVNEIAASFVDLVGNYQGVGDGSRKEQHRILGVIFDHNDKTVFVKLVGPNTTIEKEYKNFEQFYTSLRYTKQ